MGSMPCSRGPGQGPSPHHQNASHVLWALGWNQDPSAPQPRRQQTELAPPVWVCYVRKVQAAPASPIMASVHLGRLGLSRGGNKLSR